MRRGRPCRPSLNRNLGRRRRGSGRRRGCGLSLIVIVRAQELTGREPPERSDPGRQLERLRSRLLGRGLAGVLAVIAQERAGRTEHPRLLPLTGGSRLGRRHPSWSARGRRHRSARGVARTCARLGRLGIQLDVPLGPDDVEALLQILVEPQLGNDARNDAQPRGERDLIHRRHVAGAGHRHLDAAPVHREREHVVLLDQGHWNRSERG